MGFLKRQRHGEWYSLRPAGMDGSDPSRITDYQIDTQWSIYHVPKVPKLKGVTLGLKSFRKVLSFKSYLFNSYVCSSILSQWKKHILNYCWMGLLGLFV